MTSSVPGVPAAVIVIGGGPAGLMAADVISRAGIRVDLYDAMPSVGRKFLLAGIGGLNLTHCEPSAQFIARYGERAAELAPLLAEFDAAAVRDWARELGIETFIGSSGRVFPREMKAAPLLRHWLRRLRSNGVQIHVRERWCGWTDTGELRFHNAQGEHYQAKCCRKMSCSRSAAAAGPSSVPMRRGCRCCNSARFQWCRCAQPIAVLKSPGVIFLNSALPAAR